MFLPAPHVGQLVWFPELAGTLRRIAEEGAGGLLPRPRRRCHLRGPRRSRSTTSPTHADWVEPLRRHYRGVDVCEIPPNGQGVAALQALGILGGLDHTGARALDRVHLQAEAMKLAFADAERYVHDGPLPAALPRRRLPRGAARADRPARAGAPAAGALEPGGTVYLCAVDEDRNACSLIQSVYHGFGSLVVAPGHRHRAAEPRRTASRSSPGIPTGSRPASARTTRSSRACCCATAACSGRSA